MISKTILSIAALCLFAGCNVSLKEKSCAGKALNPKPADGAKGVSPDAKLNWTGAPCAGSYNVYFGTKSPPPFVRNQADTIFDPGPLDWDTTYFWKIDTLGGTKGDIWKFTTFWYGDPNADEMNVRRNNKDKNEEQHSAKIAKW